MSVFEPRLPVARPGWARRFYRVAYFVFAFLVFVTNLVVWPALIWILGS